VSRPAFQAVVTALNHLDDARVALTEAETHMADGERPYTDEARHAVRELHNAAEFVRHSLARGNVARARLWEIGR
jgi:hypothetical protein